MEKRWIIIFFCSLIIIGCQPKNSMKSQLKNRVNKYYEHVIKGEHSLEWDFLWHDAKRRWKKDEWINFTQQFDSKTRLLNYRIKSVSIYKMQNYTLGKVSIEVEQRLLEQNKTEKYVGDENWVYENGDWFRHIEPW